MKIVLPIFVIVCLVAVVVLAQLKSGSQTGRYKRGKLMTDNERAFFGRLVNALPDHYIFPQVAMSALLEPSSSDRRRSHSDRLRIAQQRVDYVVCDNRCEVIAVVELDDKTHSPAKDQARDERLLQAGIRTIRFQSRKKPSVEEIRAAIIPPVVSVPPMVVIGNLREHSSTLASTRTGMDVTQL